MGSDLATGSVNAIVHRNLRDTSSALGYGIVVWSHVGGDNTRLGSRDIVDHSYEQPHRVVVSVDVVDGHPYHHGMPNLDGGPRDLHDIQLRPERHQHLNVVLVADGHTTHVVNATSVLFLNEPNDWRGRALGCSP